MSFNYKGLHSIVVLRQVDSDYKFIFTDAGCQSSVSDRGVLYNHLISDELRFPDTMEPPESQNPAQNFTGELISALFMIVGNKVFSLNKHFMKPYEKTRAGKLKEHFQLQFIKVLPLQ